MRPRERRADAVGEPVGDEAVDGVALGRHRPPLGGGDLRGDFGELVLGAVGQPAFAELQRADQRAMDDQVGIAADRRGEVGVAAEVQAEMADVLRAVFGLRLRAQHHLVEKRRVLATPWPRSRMRLKCAGRRLPPFGSDSSIEARNSRSASSLASEGVSWMR